jgi:DnaJ-domain-containing protein 1
MHWQLVFNDLKEKIWMSSRQLDDAQELATNRKLASELGISVEDLSQLEWEIEANASEDGLIYEYIVIFSEESSIEILEKISNIDGYTFSLQPSFFEELIDYE